VQKTEAGHIKATTLDPLHRVSASEQAVGPAERPVWADTVEKLRS